MTELVDIHPSLRLDHTVERKNESHHHWAAKAAIADVIRSDSALVGVIETERKTGERIADIRCVLSKSPPDMPRQFAVEIETPASNKDRHQATIDHLRHGFAVFWVFTGNATDERRTTEELLGNYLSSRPSLGVVALSDGELSLGAPITWGEMSYKAPWLGRMELQIPTYDRREEWYNHGDFKIDDQRVSLLRQRQPGYEELYISEYAEGDQQTLPKPSALSMDELQQRIQDGSVKRISPVRGPP